MVDIGKEVLQEKIEDDLAFLRYIQTDIGMMQGVRELCGGEDGKIKELIRGIIILETQTIEGLKRKIEHDREDLKKLG